MSKIQKVYLTNWQFFFLISTIAVVGMFSSLGEKGTVGLAFLAISWALIGAKYLYQEEHPKRQKAEVKAQ